MAFWQISLPTTGLDDDNRIVERYLLTRDTNSAFKEHESKYENGHRVLLTLKQLIDLLGKEFLSEKSSEDSWRALLEIASAGMDISRVNPELSLAINELILNKIAFHWQTDFFRQYQHNDLRNLVHRKLYHASTKRAIRHKNIAPVNTQQYRRAVTAATISDFKCVLCAQPQRASECPLAVNEKKYPESSNNDYASGV